MRIISNKGMAIILAGLYTITLLGHQRLKLQQKQSNRSVPTITQNKTFYTELATLGTFLYSAFIDMELDEKNNLGRTVHNNKTLIILAWQNKSLTAQELRCCILSSEKLTTQDVMKINRRGGTDIQVIRFECLLYERYTDITGVSLTTKYRPCSENKHHYITPTILSPYEQDDSVAMCNDLLYGEVNPKLMVEWFEIHRFLGVDKFTIHQDRSLNSIARYVLQYYRREGILEVLDFESPVKDAIYRHKRAENLPKNESKSERQQMWTDESLAIFDCRERHKHYAFAVDIDQDEFVVPQIVERNAIKTHLTNLFRKNTVGVYSLYANLHFTSGKATDATHPLWIGRYQDATQPVDDRVKNIYMPSRVEVGKGMIHQLIPKYGFTREYIDPSIATFHHFRECRTKTPFAVPAYSNGTTELVKIKCDSFMKNNSTAIQQLLNLKIILANVLNVFATLKI